MILLPATYAIKRNTGCTSPAIWEVDTSINIITPGEYWLQVTDTNGCLAKEYINITSKNCVTALYFPNAFTPDNDGTNDVYKPILYGGAIVKFHFLIYNRFGQKVYESYDINKGWNGWYKNTMQDNEVFVWYCEYQLKNESVKNQKGIVTLIR